MELNSRKISTWVVVGIAAIFSIILLFQFIQDPDEEYQNRIMLDRVEKDRHFSSSEDSPLPDSVKSNFRGLSYFIPDRRFKVDANFVPNPKEEFYEIEMKNGEAENYIKAGKLEFEINGQALTLTAFAKAQSNRKQLFIPFRDVTSGKTTYGGGRYIDTRRIKNLVILDFNSAYNPYCVYDIQWVCPIPPAENNLTIAIEAGELIFKPFMP